MLKPVFFASFIFLGRRWGCWAQRTPRWTSECFCLSLISYTACYMYMTPQNLVLDVKLIFFSKSHLVRFNLIWDCANNSSLIDCSFFSSCFLGTSWVAGTEGSLRNPWTSSKNSVSTKAALLFQEKYIYLYVSVLDQYVASLYKSIQICKISSNS